jgi:hypothetical protein
MPDERDPMPTHGFAPGTLNPGGYPAWIADLGSREAADHTVHVISDMEPAIALQLLGAEQRLITPCQLPADRRDRRTSLPRTGIGPADCSAVLLAGRIGAWTFVYDDAALTSLSAGHAPPAKLLSAYGRTAATSTTTLKACTDLAYAVDGQLLIHITAELDPAERGQDIPAGLQAAVEAARIFELDYPGKGEPDGAINMRVLCALAELHCTLDDLREIPLLAAPLPSWLPDQIRHAPGGRAPR